MADYIGKALGLQDSRSRRSCVHHQSCDIIVFHVTL